MMECEVLKVLFDYSYEYKEKQISISHGENLKLLQRTNQHWWKVVRPNQNRPFFVPAQYVKTVSLTTTEEDTPSPTTSPAIEKRPQQTAPQFSSGGELSSEGESSATTTKTTTSTAIAAPQHPTRFNHKPTSTATATSAEDPNPTTNNHYNYKIQYSPSLRVSSSSKHHCSDADHDRDREFHGTDSMKMKRTDSSRASKRALKVKNWSASLEELSKQIVFPGLSAESVMNLTTDSNKKDISSPAAARKKNSDGGGGTGTLLNTSNSSCGSSGGSPSSIGSKPVPLPRRTVNEFQQSTNDLVMNSPKPIPKVRSKTAASLCDKNVTEEEGRVGSSKSNTSDGSSSEVLNTSSCEELDQHHHQHFKQNPKSTKTTAHNNNNNNNSKKEKPEKSPILTTFSSNKSNMKPKQSTILTIPAPITTGTSVSNSDRDKSLSTDSVNSTTGSTIGIYSTISSTTSINSHHQHHTRSSNNSSSKPPKPTPDEKPIRLMLDNWAEYVIPSSSAATDSTGGRHYYYNQETGATSWKPPRINSLKTDSTAAVTASGTGGASSCTGNRSKTSSNSHNHGQSFNNNYNHKNSNNNTKVRVGSGGSISSIGENKTMKSTTQQQQQLTGNAASSEASSSFERQSAEEEDEQDDQLPQLPSQLPLPDGWRCSIDSLTGQPCFINDSTGAKWFSSQDPQGKIYYYEENSAKSSWFLPVPGISVNNDESSSSAPLSKSTTSDSLEGRESTPPKNTMNIPIPDTNTQNTISSTSSIGASSGGGVKKRFSTGDMSTDRFLKARSLIILEPRKGLEPARIASLPRSPPKSIWSTITPSSTSSTAGIVGFSGGEDEELIPVDVIKEGTLSRTRITENGKKVRKNWSTSYVVLTEKHLSLFKDHKSFANTASRKSEMEIELAGCNLGWALDKSSRKNVFQLNTNSDFQILFQTDDKELATEWYDKIAELVDIQQQSDYTLRLRSTSPDTFLDNPVGEKKSSTTRLGRAKSTKVKISGSQENLTSEDIKKLRTQLKKFFIRRPGKESLIRKGIYKDEAVFGCHLEKLCSREQSQVPRFVEECIKAIESKEENLKLDGLYRVSGNLSQVQKIRLQVDQNNLTCLFQEEDVHVLAGSLKLFFREMKEPLIPSDLFDKALAASHLPVRKERVSRFCDIVGQLARSNRATLSFLLKHLLKVSKYSEFNRMQIPNLAIVFGPTLMWPAQESTNMALDLMQQNSVIEALLIDYDAVFEKK